MINNLKTILEKTIDLPYLIGNGVINATKKLSSLKIHKSTIIAIAVIVLLGPAVFLVSKKPKAAKAGWYNDNWMYRRSIAATNNSSEENNVYISTTIDSSDADKFQDDCGDLRFTKINGQQLDYYISSGCGTASTIVHINFDTFPSGSQTLYYYYGNPSVKNGFQSSDFTTEASNYSIGSIGSEEQSPGPAAYWKFDEGYGDTAYDSTENSNTGSFGTEDSAPQWQPEDMCISGKCLYFDGTDDYIEAPHLNQVVYNGTYTFSVWIKTNSQSSGTIFSNFNSDNSDRNGLVVSSGLVKFGYYDGSWHGVSGSISDNKWHHVVGVNDATNLSLYIDGVLQTGSSSPYVATGNSFYIGKHSITDRDDCFFQGYIDEPKIYPYARSAEEIKADYASRGSVQGVSANLGSAPNSSGSLSDGLVGYWKMDESSWDGTADEVIDSSGNGNHGTAQGTTPATTESGKFGNGGTFDGTNQSVSISNFNSLSSGSFSMWIKPSSIDTNEGLIDSSQFDIFQWSSGDGEIYFRAGGGSYQSSTSISNWAANSWHHVVMTWDGNNYYGYLDGEIKTSGEQSGSSGTSINLAKVDSGYYYNGNIDEVRVYNRSLSPKEVRDLYSWAPGPVAYYNFNEGSGTNLYDRSGNGNDSSSFGGDPTWTTGKFGKGLEFDGDSDTVSISESSQLKPNKNITIEAWVNSSHVDTYEYIITKYYGGDAASYALYTGSSGGIFFYIDPVGDSNTVLSPDGGTDIWDGNWHHLAGVYDGSKIELFVDGTSQGSTETSLDISYSSQQDLWIGSSYNGSHEISSKIDEVRIYNYARTSKQIVEDMNAGHPVGGSPVGSQVEYWRFDNNLNSIGTGNSTATVFDSASATYTADGKFGSALDFSILDSGTATWVDNNTLRDTSKSWEVNQWAGYQFATAYNPGSQYCRDTIDSNTATDLVFSSTCNSFEGDKSYEIRKTLYVSGPISSQSDSEITASLWFKSNGSQSEAIARMADHAFDFYILTDGIRAAMVHYSNTITHTTNPHDGSWHYIASTYDSNTHILYYDGKEVARQSLSESLPTTNNYFRLGTRNDGHNTFFDGYIDEVKIYNSALTEDEIKLDYNQGKSNVMGAISTESDGTTPSFSSSRSYCPPGDTSTCSPPVAEWKFDEKTGTDANDTSGNGNTGTLTNMESSDWKSSAQCHKGGCLEFDGESGNNEGVDISAFDTPTTAISVSAWINPTTITGDNRQWLVKDNGGGFRSYIHATNETISWKIAGNEMWSSTTLNENNWYFVAFTFDPSTDEQKIYINGSLDNSDTNTGTITNDGNAMSIGYDSNDNYDWFNGFIDTVRIYDYARTPAQIAWDYNQGEPVGWWKLDEAEGTTAYDSSGNGNNGTLEASMTNDDWVTGKINTALDFDGENDYVEVDFPTDSLGIAGTQSVTVGAWLKLNEGTSSWRTALVFDDDTYSEGDLMLRKSNLGNFAVYLRDQGGQHNTSVPFPTNEWQHLLFTYDGTQVIIYVNGKKVYSANESGSINSPKEKITIGNWLADGIDQDWEGQIDDVRIYNYALTAAQVKNLYNQNSSVRFGE